MRSIRNEGSFSFGTVPFDIAAQGIRRNLLQEERAGREATKLSYAVRDAVTFARHMQGKQLYESALPITRARVRVAGEVLSDFSRPEEIKDIVAQPLLETISPLSSAPWYERLQIAQTLAGFDEHLVKGFERYELGQEYALFQEVNTRGRDFIDGFVGNEFDFNILRNRLEQAIRFGKGFDPSIPLDVWIQFELDTLSRIPIGDVRMIAAHPDGMKVLSCYEQLDRAFNPRFPGAQVA